MKRKTALTTSGFLLLVALASFSAGAANPQSFSICEMKNHGAFTPECDIFDRFSSGIFMMLLSTLSVIAVGMLVLLPVFVTNFEGEI